MTRRSLAASAGASALAPASRPSARTQSWRARLANVRATLAGDAPRRRRVAGVVAAVVALAALAVLFTAPPAINANDMSRWATVESLIHRGTYQIDASPFGATVDRRYRVEPSGERVHFSSKPALLSTWVAAIAWPWSWLGFELRHPSQPATRQTIGIVLSLINVLPFACCLVAYWDYLERRIRSAWAKAVSFAAAAFGTYLTGYLTTLNSHTIGALAAFASLLLLERRPTPTKLLEGAAVGALCGLAMAHDVALSTLMAPLLLIAAWRAPARSRLGLCLGAALPAAAYFVTERVATGAWLPNQLSFALGRRSSLHMDGYWGADRDALDGVRDALGVRAFHMTLGHHGIFSLSPIFLASALALPEVARWRSSASSRRMAAAFGLVVAASATSFVLFLLKTTNYGGLCQGFRWLFGFIPAWLMLLPRALDRSFARRPAIVALTVAALAVSAYSALSAMLDPWELSWLHRWYLAR
jgi:hypothetical protein